MRIAICDDTKEDRDDLKQSLYRLEQELGMEFDLVEYETPSSLLEYMLSNDFEVYDILFVDIYMPGFKGTDVVRLLREKGYDGHVVFVTTSTEFALESYSLQADGYLTKPYDYEAFKAAIWRIIGVMEKLGRTISIVSDRIEYNIPLKDIIFIESENKGCMVHTVKENLFTWKKLNAFIAELEAEKNFYHLDRSHLINLNHIEDTGDDDITLSDRSVLYMPTRERNRIHQQINDYFWNITRG